MEVVNATHKSIDIFSKVLNDSATWLNSINQPMWKYEDITSEELLKKYSIEDMKLCYEKGNLIRVYILQWYDPLFWANLQKNESGIMHKLAVCRESVKKGYGHKLIQSVELICKEHNVKWLRLNCGTFRDRLRNFYESNGFKMVDRVFIDNRDRIRYEKFLNL
ncbi:GNAT family N-acetyltransferase [Clostridium beijerinckii]|uniref:GNAT family N-acetyltransferase n=1 Tax=Clostridium beijerinckii TaxID=1520 RepID=A0AAW3W389_CLOBE|nr:GNAT family N-acetyltransferase [Clostridium beijerinckii]MBC2456909.1 GNAT family N-acetyltransferase [Clostridium beijerinckii]MBC2473352.1 GNAT family N-acetyltransferase [Clostridium beijerinckii]NOV60307.1 GNAT superfamily N-acetyltransferase [Clostridium beijerinckii]NOV70917.1 GNAT superfamily N-acetyltransferase [Clostridium beijerinckii]NOW33835.1 GNAT superfamily N-acetyltransferase [Clostridium beijerinckii]